MQNRNEEIFEKIISDQIKVMNQYLNTTKDILPMSFFFILPNGTTMKIDENILQNLSKQKIAELINVFCQKFLPVCVVHVYECWFANTSSLEEINKYGQVRFMPSAIDGFSISISYSREGRLFMKNYLAPVLTKEDGSKFIDDSKAIKNDVDQTDSKYLFKINKKYLTSIE